MRYCWSAILSEMRSKRQKKWTRPNMVKIREGIRIAGSRRIMSSSLSGSLVACKTTANCTTDRLVIVIERKLMKLSPVQRACRQLTPVCRRPFRWEPAATSEVEIRDARTDAESHCAAPVPSGLPPRCTDPPEPRTVPTPQHDCSAARETIIFRSWNWLCSN